MHPSAVTWFLSFANNGDDNDSLQLSDNNRQRMINAYQRYLSLRNYVTYKDVNDIIRMVL